MHKVSKAYFNYFVHGYVCMSVCGMYKHKYIQARVYVCVCVCVSAFLFSDECEFI